MPEWGCPQYSLYAHTPLAVTDRLLTRHSLASGPYLHHFPCPGSQSPVPYLLRSRPPGVLPLPTADCSHPQPLPALLPVNLLSRLHKQFLSLCCVTQEPRLSQCTQTHQLQVSITPGLGRSYHDSRGGERPVITVAVEGWVG